MAKKKTRAKKRASKRKPVLTPKQKRFTEEYLLDMNAAQAAIRAGYGEKGAQKEGSRLLGYSHVREAVDKAVEARSVRTELTQDVLLKELYRIVTFTRDNYDINESDATEDPVKAKPGAPAGVMSAIAQVKKRMSLTGRTVVEIIPFDKNKGLSLAMRHLGMLNDKLTLDFDEETRKLLAGASEEYDRRTEELAKRIEAGKVK